MSFILRPYELALVVLASWVNQQQQQVIEYLRTENQILRNLTDPFDGFLKDSKYVLMDRDSNFSVDFRSERRASTAAKAYHTEAMVQADPTPEFLLDIATPPVPGDLSPSRTWTTTDCVTEGVGLIMGALWPSL